MKLENIKLNAEL